MMQRSRPPRWLHPRGSSVLQPAASSACRLPTGRCGCRSGTWPQFAVLEILGNLSVGNLAVDCFNEMKSGLPQFPLPASRACRKRNETGCRLAVPADDDFFSFCRFFDQRGKMRLCLIKAYQLAHTLIV